ncbi:MAG TPA: Calx-beta domain-containing protein, partial [Pyrinomonadaceae bacterium]|nr:Calx-beta domain-containing protein [Pyrinomonadaceae bacterium]
ANFVAYGGSTGLDSDDNQSLTRAPDISGSFTKHGPATGGARLFSPGTQFNGSPFSACGPAIERVEVSPSSATIDTGQQQPFTARAFDANNSEVAGVLFFWQASNMAVATIDQNGLATGLRVGSTQIRATGRGTQSSPATLVVNQAPPDLSITKTVSPGPVFIGSNLIYSIVVTNNGAVAAQSVVVTDNLPAGLSFVSCSATSGGVCAGTDNNRTVTFASIASGATRTITLVARAHGPAGTISNTATVSASTPDPNLSNNSASASTLAQEPPPSLTLNDITANEGNSGSTIFTFTVSLSSPAPANVSFDISTQDHSATVDGNDYVARALTARTIPAGQQTYSFDVTVNGDLNVEPAETFFVNVKNVSGAILTDGQGRGTIENDDTANLVISQSFAGGGNAGAPFSNDFVEIFNRGNTTVDFATTPYSIQYAGATANFGSNKVDLNSGSILPGRYFLVQLSGGVVGSPLPTPDDIGGIVMAATAGKVALVAGTTSLSGTGCPLAATVADFIGYGATASCFEVPGPAPAPSATTADFRKAGGCTDTNDNAADFFAHAPAPRNSASPLNDCSGPPPNLTINGVTATEGNSGSKIFTFTVSLSAPAQGIDVMFDIATQDNTATTADHDYVARSLTSQILLPGQQTCSFDVVVNGDAAFEPNENFFVNVTNVTGATVTDGQAVGTIENDDEPSLSINDVILAEGDTGTKVFNFTVSLSAPVASVVVFDINTLDNTARVADGDYVAQALVGQTIPAGQTTYNFGVEVNGDLKIEANESFFVNLSNVSGVPVADGQGAGNIQNDDTAALSVSDVSMKEGNSGPTTFTFNITSSLPAPVGGVTFNIATQDGTATALGGDYVARSLTNQTIPAGQSTYTFEITVNGDLLVEPNESFFVNITNVANATTLDGWGSGTIENEDTANLVISQLYTAGGNAGAPFANDFVEILNRGNTTVNFATTRYSIQYAGATANFGSNRVDLTSGTILPGQYFLVQLSGGINGLALPPPDAKGSIVMATTAGKVALVVGATSLPVSTCPGDNDEPPFNPGNLAIADFIGYGATASCFEGKDGPAPAPGATASDFRRNGGCTDTNDNEADFFLHAPAPRNSSSPLNVCTPGPTPALSIDDVIATEGNEGTKIFSFIVSLSSPAPSTDVTFDIATQDLTATTANNDYVARQLTKQIIPAGHQTYRFDVVVNGDVAAEPDEAFAVDLSNLTGAVIIGDRAANDARGVGTIGNDDLPSLSINDISLAEGDSGTTTFNFTLSLSAPAPEKGVSFDIGTANGSAVTADDDYVSQSLGSRQIGFGQQTFTFSVLVNGDLTIEPNETFLVNVSNVGGASVSDFQAMGTILNDDSPVLSVNDVAVTEGNSGTTTASFTVTSSRPAPAGGITFNISTHDDTATASSEDYVSKTLTNQTIPAGSAAYTFDVTTNGDTLVESDETFLVKLTAVSGATISDDTGLGTIQNDDTPNIVVSQLYGGGGNAGAVFKNDFIEVFNRGATTINLAGWSVQYTSATGSTWSVTPLCSTATCLLLPGQYFLVEEDQGSGGTTNLPTPDATGTIAMTAGAGKVAVVSSATALSGTCPSSANILDLVGYGATASCFEGSPAPAPSNTLAALRKGGGCVDTANNAADLFTHSASPRSSAYPINACSGQTVDLTINDVTVMETDAEVVAATFTVTLHGSTGSTVTVDYSTSDVTAVAPSDYQAITSTQLVFIPGDVTKTVTVHLNGDTLDEPNETFFVNLSNATNAAILDNQGQGTITDNDVPPALSLNDVSQNETNGVTTLAFTVHLSAPALTGGVSFDIATADGTAQDDNPASEDNDYVGQALTGVTIPAGSQDYVFNVTVNGDVLNEQNETFFVTVSNVSGAIIGDAQGLATIQNDDSPMLNINDVTQAEGNAGASIFNFTVTSTLPAPTGGISFQINTIDGTAQDDNPVSEDDDYVPQVGAVFTIPDGQTFVTVPVTVNGDILVEANETFTVNISNISGASPGDSQGFGTIHNDDKPDLVISQIYPGGNNAGATYRNDFIEIFNRGTTTVDFAITPYSVQYAGATAAFASAKTDLISGSIAPGQYFLIQEAGGTTNGSALPTPDATGTIAMATTGGKVALVIETAFVSAVTCPGDDAVPPANPRGNNIVDFVGYASGANCFEGSGSAPFSTSTAGGLDPDARSVIRTVSCNDTNNNSGDFTNPTTAPTARNTATTSTPCP